MQKTSYMLHKILLFCLGIAAMGSSRAQTLQTSNLPIVVIDTRAQAILEDPKIMARMGIIDNGPGRTNQLTDPFNGYDGWIGIEYRGSSRRGTQKSLTASNCATPTKQTAPSRFWQCRRRVTGYSSAP